MTRSTLALTALAAACCAALADASAGWGWFLDSPLVLVAPALAAYAVGGWCRPPVAAAAGVLATASLTAANQVAGQGYHWLDDLVFFTVVVGGPAVAGAAVTVRARQVARLERLQAELDEQHRIDVAAARLDEQVRIQQDVHARLAERIAAIAVRAQGARAGADDAALAAIETEAREVLDQLRGALGSLAAAPAAAAEQPVPGVDAPRPSVADVALALAIALGLTVEAVVGAQARGPVVANALAALVVVAPLVVRRSRPLPAVGASLLAALAMTAWLTPVPGTVTGVAYLVLVFYTVGAWCRGWWWVPGWLLGAAATLALEAVSGLADDGQDGDAGWIVLLWAVGAVALGRITAGWQERVRRTGRVVAALERSRGAAVRLAVAEQRQEIAGELHDTVAHAMTVVCLQAGASRATAHGADQALATIARTATDSLAELRDGLDEMEDGSTALEPARIRALGRRMGVDVVVSGQAAPGRRTASLAQRVVREALVNVARHAPGATARVEVSTGRGELHVQVSNTGTAAESFRHGSGTGLAGLATAVRAAGGQVEFGPRAGGGFRVAATIPEEAS